MNSKAHSFSVAIIPYTYNNTTLKNLKIGDNRASFLLIKEGNRIKLVFQLYRHWPASADYTGSSDKHRRAPGIPPDFVAGGEQPVRPLI